MMGQDPLQIIIRPAVPSDAEGFLQLTDEVADETDFLNFGPGEFGLTVEQEREFLEYVSQSTGELCLVAELNGQIIGNLTFRCGTMSRTAHTGEFGVMVAKRFWGMGIGKKLVQNMLDWAKNSTEGQIRKISLTVRADNERAIRLYENVGFEREGCLRREVFIDGRFYDAIQMSCLIDPE
ncbi:GNAT family N-acetyltransferase [Brevibacillus ginsengisoli]|uniref:GNAT family N-acetyltransferase n=1 Tax=Brevibacillus ginsengisoli TaxID=363854 RepID=UPI003CF688E1